MPNSPPPPTVPLPSESPQGQQAAPVTPLSSEDAVLQKATVVPPADRYAQWVTDSKHLANASQQNAPASSTPTFEVESGKSRPRRSRPPSSLHSSRHTGPRTLRSRSFHSSSANTKADPSQDFRTVCSSDSRLRLPNARRSLAPASQSASDAKPTLELLRDQLATGDFGAALDTANALLKNHPNNADALLYRDQCVATLRQMHIARFGSLTRIPIITVPEERIRWLSLDHRAGFLLSLVDGQGSVEDIVDASGMPELDALELLCSLLEQRILKVS